MCMCVYYDDTVISSPAGENSGAPQILDICSISTNAPKQVGHLGTHP